VVSPQHSSKSKGDAEDHAKEIASIQVHHTAILEVNQSPTTLNNFHILNHMKMNEAKTLIKSMENDVLGLDCLEGRIPIQTDRTQILGAKKGGQCRDE